MADDPLDRRDINVALLTLLDASLLSTMLLVDGAVIQAHNVPVMAIPTMGEAWHNGHHAFPRSARHGLLRGQWDTSGRECRSAGTVRSQCDHN